jgi:hypothetical protein
LLGEPEMVEEAATMSETPRRLSLPVIPLTSPRARVS